MAASCENTGAWPWLADHAMVTFAPRSSKTCEQDVPVIVITVAI